MDNAQRSLISAGFSAAADGYDRHASVHRQVATILADRVAALDLLADAAVLEVGCGTGLLTERLVPAIPAARLTITDASDAMLAQAARRGPASARYALYDADTGMPPGGPYDLVVSSLAAQWFADLAASIERLGRALAPGGRLMIAIVGAGSFASWRDAHAVCGLGCGLRDFPDERTLSAILARIGPAAKVKAITLPAAVANAGALVRHFRGLGAHVARPGHVPLSGGALRRVMAAYDAAGGTTDYQVLIGEVQRDG